MSYPVVLPLQRLIEFRPSLLTWPEFRLSSLILRPPYNWSLRLQTLDLTLLPNFFQQHRSELEVSLQHTQVPYLIHHSRTFKTSLQPPCPHSPSLHSSHEVLNLTLIMTDDISESSTSVGILKINVIFFKSTLQENKVECKWE